MSRAATGNVRKHAAATARASASVRRLPVLPACSAEPPGRRGARSLACGPRQRLRPIAPEEESRSSSKRPARPGPRRRSRRPLPCFGSVQSDD
jgi:hypothetical protein